MIREEVSNNYECQWQQKNWELHEKTKEKENHVSIFCSLNNWASHITDMLMDTQFDNVILYPDLIEEKMFDDEKGEKVDIDTYDHQKLSRHYGRFLLVVSELIVDFGDIAKQLGKNDYSDYYSKGNIFNYSAVRGFINNVFKHKTTNFQHRTCTKH